MATGKLQLRIIHNPSLSFSPSSLMSSQNLDSLVASPTHVHNSLQSFSELVASPIKVSRLQPIPNLIASPVRRYRGSIPSQLSESPVSRFEAVEKPSKKRSQRLQSLKPRKKAVITTPKPSDEKFPMSEVAQKRKNLTM